VTEADINTKTSVRDLAAHLRPRFAGNFLTLQSEGAGNTGCTLHPRSRVQQCTKQTHTSIQVQRRQSGIPCAMVLRLISRSPRRSGFLVTVIGGAASADLTPASRRQDHTTLPSASVPFVNGTSASTASHPASVTIAIRPSVGWDSDGYRGDLGVVRTGIFLRKGLDSKFTDLPVGHNQPAIPARRQFP
jgi:hypothetical protein